MGREKSIVKQLLKKSIDSAMLAIEFYNKPGVSFRTEGFITIMCIAWTSLFHAYFLKNSIKPYYAKKSAGMKRVRYEKIVENVNGQKIKEYKWWELSTCLKEFYKDDMSNPVRKNLEFLISLRNRIVHRNVPQSEYLDLNVYGECQACLLNFNDFLVGHFGEKYNIGYLLSFSLQLAGSSRNVLNAIQVQLKKGTAGEVFEFINKFRSSLSNDIRDSSQYALKLVLIELKNHESEDAISVKFIKQEELTDEQNRCIVGIKNRNIFRDDVREGFTLDYKQLWLAVKEQIPNIKRPYFNNINRYLRVRYRDKLAYERLLDPRNPKTSSKFYYNPEIVEEFKKFCPHHTDERKEEVLRKLEKLLNDVHSKNITENDEYFNNCYAEIDRLIRVLQSND